MAMEQYFILKLRPMMNILKVARASIGREISEDVKCKNKKREESIYI